MKPQGCAKKVMSAQKSDASAIPASLVNTLYTENGHNLKFHHRDTGNTEKNEKRTTDEHK